MARTLAPLLLLALLGPAARAANPAWVEVHSQHFTLITDAGEKEGRRLLDQFERMRWALQVTQPKADADPGSPVVVMAVNTQKEFETLEPAGYQGKGKLQLAGYFLKAPDKNYILLRLDVDGEHPWSTVYHEYTHLQLGTPGMPLWLNEGLAQFFENTQFRNKDVLVGEPSEYDLAFLQHTPLIPLETLFRVDADSPYYHEEQKGSIFYPESWALTHYLFTSDFNNKTHHIDEYLRLVDQHTDPVTAAEQAFGDLKKLQATLSSYTNRMSYSVLKINSAAAPIDPATMTSAPITSTQVDAYRADILAYSNRSADARPLLDAILKADPNNVLAHETMGYLAFHDGKRDEAKKWYSQAVALDSQSSLAQYYYAALSLADGETGPQVEASLRAAIKLNPRFAPAYDGLAQLYGRRHDNLDEAHILGVQAVQLDPGNLGYRLNAANLLMEQQRFDDAILVLQAAKACARTAEDDQIVEMRIGQVRVYKDQYAQQQNVQASVQVSSSTQSPSAVRIITGANGATVSAPVTDSDDAAATAPKHVAETPHGKMLVIRGVIHGVACSYPAQMDLQVQGPARKLALFAPNYYKIDLSAANFTPKGEVHPCADLEGMKAEVEYFVTADKSVDGQIVAIMMIK
jgi:tetratricopeptide (TPR) repeat protein